MPEATRVSEPEIMPNDFRPVRLSLPPGIAGQLLSFGLGIGTGIVLCWIIKKHL